jgi:thioester reductase-like protein
MNGGMPGTVYRPGIVVGDSRTGATQKYDGPYPIIRWLLRQPRIALMPVVGDPREFRANIVPRDFVVAAVGHLAFLPRSRGTVYQLAESEGLTVDGALRELARATGRRVIRVPLSRKLSKAALRRVPGLQPLMQIPPAAVDYFAHPTLYTSENSRRDLEGTGIQAPPFSSYAQRLVDFVIQNPGVPSEPMV